MHTDASLQTSISVLVFALYSSSCRLRVPLSLFKVLSSAEKSQLDEEWVVSNTHTHTHREREREREKEREKERHKPQQHDVNMTGLRGCKGNIVSPLIFS